MGHIENAKSSLIPLIDRLNKYPIGLVDNEILREILSLLFDKSEVYVASKFPLQEATLNELVKSTKMTQDELLPVLNSMADKGLIMDMPYDDTKYYLLMPGLIGFFEFTFMKNRTDLPLDKIAKLMTEYFNTDPQNGQAKELFGTKTQLTRSLVYEDHIPVTSVITPYESARDIIKQSKFGAVTMCYCRHKRQHEGKKCKKGAPIEGTCIVLNNGARFLVRRGFAEEKSTQELLDILEYTNSLNLTHVTDNIRNKPTFICNCCRCCCELMHGVQMGYFEGIGKTSYIAVIDSKQCNYCGECFTACNVKAIGPSKTNKKTDSSERFSIIKEDICLGCGACISACKKGAISLIPRKNYKIPKRNKRELFISILLEKKRLSPFLVEIFMKRMKKVFRIN